MTPKSGGTTPGDKGECGAIIDCDFSTSSAVLAAKSSETGAGTFTANGIELAGGSGSRFPTKAKWTATYTITEPTPVFIEKG